MVTKSCQKFLLLQAANGQMSVIVDYCSTTTRHPRTRRSKRRFFMNSAPSFQSTYKLRADPRQSIKASRVTTRRDVNGLTIGRFDFNKSPKQPAGALASFVRNDTLLYNLRVQRDHNRVIVRIYWSGHSPHGECNATRRRRQSARGCTLGADTFATMRRWIFAVLLLLAGGARCQSQEVYSLNKLVIVCGTVLPRAVDEICRGVIKVQSPEDYEEYMKSRRGKKAALKYAYRRRRRQIVDECCNKACTVAELMTYCPDGWR
ncbi:Bombyxin C-1 [Eumeta japonica]|uniref:Bombyxin C-1 n=1 Tax=Eumeta variegata TaxID=151549 RepID=A0A4C1VRJ5_EUMVA|nr:Bombyxin C-1 [Eumeta japonica]